MLDLTIGIDSTQKNSDPEPDWIRKSKSHNGEIYFLAWLLKADQRNKPFQSLRKPGLIREGVYYPQICCQMFGHNFCQIVEHNVDQIFGQVLTILFLARNSPRKKHATMLLANLETVQAHLKHLHLGRWTDYSGTFFWNFGEVILGVFGTSWECL